MAQNIEGTMPFEQAQPTFQDVLAPWLAFVAQATVKAELYALTHAIEAVCREQEWRYSYQQGLWSLCSGVEELTSAAVAWFESMERAINQACWHWQHSISWLREFGLTEKAALYQPLYAHAQQQQQRLLRQAQDVRKQVARLCQEWGLVFDDSRPPDETA